VWKLVKRIGGIELSYDVTKLGDLVENLAAENSILQARIKGLQNAVFIEKKRRKRGKLCIKNICTTSAIRELARNCGASDSPVSLVLLGNR
jgi:hypothetical protein